MPHTLVEHVMKMRYIFQIYQFTYHMLFNGQVYNITKTLTSSSSTKKKKHTPETNRLPVSEGERSILMTSPACPWKLWIS